MPTNNSQNNEAQAPRRKKKSSGGASGGASYFILIVGISLLISGIAIFLANDVFALVKEDRTAIIELTEETSGAEVASLLKSEGLIKSKMAFVLYTKVSGSTTTFKKGKFEINASMDYGQMISTLKRVPTYSEIVKTTIPEGYTIAQIAELLEETRVCSADEFIEKANVYPFKHEILQDVPMENNRLEGFLFPDTYEFYVNDNPVRVLNTMLNNFNRKYTDEMRKMVEKSGKSLREILIMASMVEREAMLQDEQAKIAGVITNRLNNPKNFPFLNIDATIQYVVGHKEALTAEDLKIDSPYNTYTNKGLPPGAIANPGTPAILAALQPEKHGFYYYVADPTTGGHVFTKTLEEHNAAVANMRKKAGN